MNARATRLPDSQALQYFCRHLVALCVAFEFEGDNAKRRFAAYAGTLIRIRGATCFLTAGHILREIEEALSRDDVEIKDAVLADTFGLGRICDLPIPFDLKGSRRFFIDSEEDGLDFGVIALEPYYVRLLVANSAIALEERNWIYQGEVTFDVGYAMLGLPEEFTSGFLTAEGHGTVSPTMFRVHRLASPPEGRAPTRHPQFVGRIDRELGLKSVKGMSGGPIFGFRHEPDGNYRYWIVALQSSWLSESRTVFGCSLPVLASLMTQWIDEAIEAA